MKKAFVYRTQFPISLAYAITIHKCQALSLSNVLLDIGTSVFSCGQAYVALSRVTSLNGLHIINVDHSQIKALDSAIVEINRLRQNYRPDLSIIHVEKCKRKRENDRKWTDNPHIGNVLQEIDKSMSLSLTKRQCHISVKGFVNTNNLLSHINAFVACLLQSKIIQLFFKKCDVPEIKQIALQFEEGIAPIDNSVLLRVLELNPKQHMSQCWELLDNIFVTLPGLQDKTSHAIETTLHCNCCHYTNSTTHHQMVFNVGKVNKSKITSMKDLLDTAFQWKHLHMQCSKCKDMTDISQRQSLKNIPECFIIRTDETTPSAIINGISGPVAKINDLKFAFRSALFAQQPHYFAFLNCDTGWIKVENSNVAKKSWPRGSKNMQVMILDRQNP
jgi:hypothetical protein